MDPNEALRQLRAVAGQVMRGDRDASYEMVWLFRALDAWLSKGGFSPAEWMDKQAGYQDYDGRRVDARTSAVNGVNDEVCDSVRCLGG